MKWATVFVATLLIVGCTSEEELAKQAVEATLLSRDTASYKELTTYPGKVVCGKYEVQDKWGVAPGVIQFIYRESELNEQASNEDWAVFCSADPADSLYQETGINVAELSNKQLKTIRQDFSTLEAKMAKRAPKTVEMPNDPWGTPYKYIEPWFAGVQGELKIVSYGADGKEGGKDENADIGNWHMKYIEHVRGL